MTHDSAPDAGALPLPHERQWRFALAIAVLIVVLDQVSKMLIERLIGPDRDRSEIWIAGDWLGLQYVRNRGVAFGIPLGSSILTLLVGTLVFVLLGWLFWREAGDRRLTLVGLGLLGGGAIGNMIDRLRIGAVVDYVAIAFWPRFNIADSAITIGVILLAVSSLISSDRVKPHDLPAEEQTVHAACEREHKSRSG